ncbi:MAG: DUF302 domain-containing protein [Sedimenticolaceae bacterium]
MKRHIGAMVAGLLVVLVAVPGSAVGDTPAVPAGFNMLIEVPSPLGFEETLERLEVNAKAAGWKVPQKWKVDFQRNLDRVTGTDIGPNQVLKMCEPHAAAKLLVKDEYKMLTAMMPCTIAVYVKSDGKTYISMMNLKAMGEMYGGDVLEMTKELGPQMDEMLKMD